MHDFQERRRCGEGLLGWLLAALTLGLPSGDRQAVAASPLPGSWHAWVESPGGKLPFGMNLSQSDSGWHAELVNGTERIKVPVVDFGDGKLVLDINHYDSRIMADLSEDGLRLDGLWRKLGRNGAWTVMKFHACYGAGTRFAAQGQQGKPPNLTWPEGTWDVKFSSSDEHAVALFTCHDNGTITGTFMTTTGDYRFLAGNGLTGDSFRLSCFDGGHAFLFEARHQPDGSIEGDFWSRDSWHETWTARKSSDARLPDAFAMTTATDVPLHQVSFRDLTGRPRLLDDPAFAGKARILEVFGTWCPNCHDAAEYLAELDRRFRDRGLSIVGIAFELTDDLKRSARQVEIFARRHGARYPMLLGGQADREKADSLFPLIDRIRSYPTLVVLDRNDKVAGIYTGFSGPATGEAHARMRERFESMIEGLLAE